MEPTKPKQKEGGEAIDVHWLERLCLGPKYGVFKVVYHGPKCNQQGTGAFYEALDGKAIMHPMFITCNHVLSTSSRNEITNVIFESEANLSLNRFQLKKEQIFRCWTNFILDVTIIELTATGEQFLREIGGKFIQIGQPKLDDRIALFQFPKGEFKFANGTILEMKNSKIMYRIATGRGSSGSPILNWNCEAVGIHNEGGISNDPTVDTTDLSQLERTASNLKDVMIDIL